MLRKNEIHRAEITDINNLGCGITRIEGAVTFVDGGVTGDMLDIRLIKIARDYCVGRIENIVVPSPHRIMPDCSVSRRCGGCVYRHITREHELELKKSYVLHSFKKAGISAGVNDVVTDGKPDGYRNKVQYPVGENGVTGYYAQRTHDIIECGSCALSFPVSDSIVKAVQAHIRKYKINSLRHIYLRMGFGTGEIMLCLVSSENRLPGHDELVRTVIKAFPQVKSIVLNINKADTNVILGKECHTLYGRDYIEDILCGLRFRISALSFYQVNHDVAGLLYGEALKRGKEISPRTVADLYCGIGTIGLYFASAMPEISLTGVEIIPQAIENAKTNALINGISNAGFICADALTAPLSGIDCVILDPPRKGLSRELADRLIDISPIRLVYVSCNPDTLARDAALLIGGGYKMDSVTPFDMFPRTGSVECVTSFSK